MAYDERLERLRVASPSRHRLSAQTSCIGQEVVIVARGNGISAAELSMPKVGHTAMPHCHEKTDVIVRVLHGNALTVIWETTSSRLSRHVTCVCFTYDFSAVQSQCHSKVHFLRQAAGETLTIPAGLIHGAINIGPLPVAAFEARANGNFLDDTVEVRELMADAEKIRDAYPHL